MNVERLLNSDYRMSYQKYLNKHTILYTDYKDDSENYIFPNTTNIEPTLLNIIFDEKLSSWNKYPKFKNSIECSTTKGKYVVFIKTFSPIVIKYVNSSLNVIENDLKSCIVNSSYSINKINELIRSSNSKELIGLISKFGTDIYNRGIFSYIKPNKNNNISRLSKLVDEILGEKSEEIDIKEKENEQKNEEKMNENKKFIYSLLLKYNNDEFMKDLLENVYYNHTSIFDYLNNNLSPISNGYTLSNINRLNNDKKIDKIYCDCKNVLLIKRKED